MSNEEIIEVVGALKANDKTMKDSGISDNLWGKAVECIVFLQSENDTLRERLKKATLNRSIYYIASIWNDATMTRQQEVRCKTVDYVCDKFVECNGLILNWDEIYFTREAAEARLAELKGDINK